MILLHAEMSTLRRYAKHAVSQLRPLCSRATAAELEPHWEAVATELKKLNKNRPDGAEEVTLIRMNTVRNDVAHFQIFTGSYVVLSVMLWHVVISHHLAQVPNYLLDPRR